MNRADLPRNQRQFFSYFFLLNQRDHAKPIRLHFDADHSNLMNLNFMSGQTLLLLAKCKHAFTGRLASRMDILARIPMGPISSIPTRNATFSQEWSNIQEEKVTIALAESYDRSEFMYALLSLLN
ncbi:hypothetical protein HMI55_000722 [Coelomomyces lativittatus]|nr:hypothetical protein HMI55_000722 [Coelomomyces lativittatus]KAJ1508606.1 hypothetical protein HMI56_007207 [Coelomomyces lativittatus]